MANRQTHCTNAALRLFERRSSSRTRHATAPLSTRYVPLPEAAGTHAPCARGERQLPRSSARCARAPRPTRSTPGSALQRLCTRHSVAGGRRAHAMQLSPSPDTVLFPKPRVGMRAFLQAGLAVPAAARANLPLRPLRPLTHAAARVRALTGSKDMQQGCCQSGMLTGQMVCVPGRHAATTRVAPPLLPPPSTQRRDAQHRRRPHSDADPKRAGNPPRSTLRHAAQLCQRSSPSHHRHHHTRLLLHLTTTNQQRQPLPTAPPAIPATQRQTMPPPCSSRAGAAKQEECRDAAHTAVHSTKDAAAGGKTSGTTMSKGGVSLEVAGGMLEAYCFTSASARPATTRGGAARQRATQRGHRARCITRAAWHTPAQHTCATGRAPTPGQKHHAAHRTTATAGHTAAWQHYSCGADGVDERMATRSQTAASQPAQATGAPGGGRNNRRTH